MANVLGGMYTPYVFIYLSIKIIYYVILIMYKFKYFIISCMHILHKVYI